jgi:4-oxalomesaconate tautomerase
VIKQTRYAEMKLKAIPYMTLRGGSSKGLYFLASDLPSNTEQRDQLLLDAMGRGQRQIDGLGGADPLTSKVAIVSLSQRDDADIDFLFAQVVVGQDRVDTTPNCGNILAGVGPFAVEAGLVTAGEKTTSLTVHMLNSGKLSELVLCTPGGKMEYEGDAVIDGVPGSAAPVLCSYLDLAGAICGELLPTGQVRDVVDQVELTCIDNGMPVVVMRAEDFGISGYEPPSELNTNETLKARLESIRLQIGPRMNLGDVTDKAVPKMCLVSAARNGGLVNTRTFIPHKCHAAVGVLGAVSVATACVMPGSVVADMVELPAGKIKQISVEHPSGEFSINLEVDESGEQAVVEKAGLLRTARLLSSGVLYVPDRGEREIA